MTVPIAALTTARPGAGPVPLVLLHAFPLDSRMWRQLAALVPPPTPVLVVDLPGAPAHATGLPEPSLDASADAVAHLLSEAGVRRAVVAGLSMGGYVALALLERHPDLVAGLGLMDTKSVADTPDAAQRRLTTAASLERSGTLDAVLPTVDGLLGDTTRTARPEVVDLVRGWVGDQVPAGLAWSQRAMAARPDRTEALRRFPGPVTVVVGDEDAVTPVELARDLALTARATLVVVPAVGHLSAVEDPAAVAAALSDLVVRSREA